MKKRLLAAIVLSLSLLLPTACGSEPASSGGDTTTTTKATEATTKAADDSTPAETPAGDVTLKVMLMPSGQIDESSKKEVEAAISEITQAAHGFSVEFVMSGDPWNFDDLVTAVQSGISGLDIIPAHTWSGINYIPGALDGQYVRLDNPDGPYGNLLEQYGQNIYKNADPSLVAAVKIDGTEGRGTYAYMPEKDSAQQLGFVMNMDILGKYGFTTDDFKPEDFANWGEKLKVIKDGEGSNFYPLNVEAEVLDRTLNYVIYTDKTTGPIGVEFDNSNPAGSEIKFVSRYETDNYRNHLQVVRGFYNDGFISPELGVNDTAPTAIANARASGDYAIGSFVYAPGAEVTLAEQSGVDVAWVPAWSAPIGSTESYLGSGLAVYAGSQNVIQSVQFLDMINTNKELADLLSSGVEGKAYTVENGAVKYTSDERGGWAIWRYGVVGANSAATPLSDPNEWTNFKTFNKNSAAVECIGFIFDRAPVELDLANCEGSIDSYAVALGSGAVDPSQLDSLVKELQAANINGIIEEANRQYAEWKSGN